MREDVEREETKNKQKNMTINLGRRNLKSVGMSVRLRRFTVSPVGFPQDLESHNCSVSHLVLLLAQVTLTV